MALCHNLITLLKGNIDVHSSLGKGTTFSVSLPVTCQDNQPVVSLTNPPTTYPSLDMRLLIVEDEPINRELMSYALIDKIAHVSAVESGKAALEFVAKHPVDIVLSDIQMPDMDGMALLALLRKQSPDLPVIAITGNALHHEQQLYADLGFNAVLAKLFNVDELIVILQAYR